jgi:hypothetical protein
MDKENVAHIYNGALLSHKEDKIVSFAENGCNWVASC